MNSFLSPLALQTHGPSLSLVLRLENALLLGIECVCELLHHSAVCLGSILMNGRADGFSVMASSSLFLVLVYYGHVSIRHF